MTELVQTKTDVHEDTRPIVLFDGVCNLCNGGVTFIVDRDDGAFRFASLQSEQAAGLLRTLGREPPPGAPESVFLVEHGQVYERSTAALKIAAKLRFPWSLAVVFWIVPRPLRDAVYRFVATHRYRWFGRTESCRVPTPALKRRFLE